MNKNPNKAPHYNVRRGVVGLAGLAALTGLAVVGEAVVQRAQHEHATVPVPAKDSQHKYFHLNEQFEVKGKTVTVDSLSTASQLAHLPGVDSRATLNMLEKQLPKGMSASEIPGDMLFDLPDNAAFGDEYYPE